MKSNIQNQSVQADGSDGEKMSADFDDEQGYNVRGFTIDGKIFVESIKEMKERRELAEAIEENALVERVTSTLTTMEGLEGKDD